MLKKTVPILVILLLALFLRTYHLGSVPPHLTVDEAALGYNAYSILKTARDEYGQFLPLVFKSFGDYKPGLYIYTAVPFIAILGLNELAVRLPSALAGVAAVYLIYLLTKEILTRDTHKKPPGLISSLDRSDLVSTPGVNTLGLIAAFLLAISPWHLHFSRGAWEANLCLTLTLAGIYLFIKSLNHPRLKISHWSLITSALTLGLTFYTYQSAKLFTPLLILGLVIFFGKQAWQQFKTYSFTFPLLIFIISLPMLIGLLTDTSGRLQVFSAFSYTRPPAEIQTLILDQDHATTSSFTFKLFHSEALNHFRTLLGHYFNYFSGRFLLFQGDWIHPAHHALYYGYFYWLDLLAISAAIYLLANLFTHHPSQPPQSSQLTLSKNPSLFFLLYWLAISPLPAVLSRDQIHAIRSYNMIIPLIILLALGYAFIANKFSQLNTVLKIPVYCLLLIVTCYNVSIYFDAYYTHFPIATSQDYQYGYRQLVQAIKTPIQNGQPIVIQQSYAQPYIFFLFYLQYPPAQYQAQAQLSASPTSAQGDVGFVEQFDNITFRPVNWSVDQFQTGTIFAAEPVTTLHPEESSDPSRFNLISEINYLNGTPAFRVVEVL